MCADLLPYTILVSTIYCSVENSKEKSPSGTDTETFSGSNVHPQVHVFVRYLFMGIYFFIHVNISFLTQVRVTAGEPQKQLDRTIVNCVHVLNRYNNIYSIHIFFFLFKRKRLYRMINNRPVWRHQVASHISVAGLLDSGNISVQEIYIFTSPCHFVIKNKTQIYLKKG